MTRVKDDDQNQRKNDIGIFNGDFDHSKFTNDDDDNMMLFWLFFGGVFLAWCGDYYDTTGKGNGKEDNEQEEYCIKVKFVYSVEECDYVNDCKSGNDIQRSFYLMLFWVAVNGMDIV